MTPVATSDQTTERFSAPIKWDRKLTRSTPGKPSKLVGYASVFNERSHDLGGFREIIQRGAFKSALANPESDLLLLANHEGLPLARESAGTLKVTEDSKGLKIEAEMAPTSQARDVMALVESGHLKEMSFAFTIGAEEWNQRENPPVRTVTQVRDLYEVTVASQGAYPQTSVSARSRFGARVTHEPSVYERNEPGISYFADLARVAEIEQRREALFESGEMTPATERRLSWEDQPPGPIAGTMEDVRKRLATVEQRTNPNSSEGTGGEFEPKNTPASVAAEFVLSATPRAALAGIIGAEPIPRDAAGKVTIPALATGTSVSSGADGSSVSTTDLTTTSHSATPIYISGYEEISQQLLDLSNPGMDLVIAGDLGAKCGAELDRQIVAGSGSNQLAGLLGTEGITTTAYTDASPTGSEFLSKLGSCFASVNTALGYEPDAIVYHGRRLAWLRTQLDEGKQALNYKPLAPEYVANAIPTTLETTQDRVLVLDTGSIKLYVDPPMLRVQPDIKSGTLQVRIVYHQGALMVVKQPKGVGIVTGTGLTTPTFP